MTKNVKWIFAQYVGESFSNGYEEYVSEDGSLCKQIWDDRGCAATNFRLILFNSMPLLSL